MQAGKTPGQQTCQPQINVAACKRVHKHMVALARGKRFNQQGARHRQTRQQQLRLQHRLRCLHFGLSKVAVGGAQCERQHGISQL